MIYFIRAGADGPVKIGYAASVKRRMAFLQAGNHQRFTLLRTLPGARKAESWLHGRFAAARIDREWFAFDAEMLTVELPAKAPLAEAPVMNEMQKCAQLVREAEARAKQLGLTTVALHVAVGVHRATWNRWRAGEFAPSLPQWMCVQALLDEHEQVA